jgi:hypothetical protein
MFHFNPKKIKPGHHQKGKDNPPLLIGAVAKTKLESLQSIPEIITSGTYLIVSIPLWKGIRNRSEIQEL